MSSDQQVASPTQVLLDPSLLLQRRAFDKTMRLLQSLKSEKSLSYWIPGRLLEHLANDGPRAQLHSFFAAGNAPTSRDELLQLLDAQLVSAFRAETLPPFMAEESSSRSLRVPVRSRAVAEVLLDEWAFLQGRSWIA